MTITLGYSRQSAPSAHRIAAASDGQIVAVQRSGDINWGRRHAAGLNADISNAVNKRQMRLLFAEHEVPSPHVYTPDEALDVMRNADESNPACLIGRPDFHTRGRGFWLCHNADQIERALRGTRRKMAATHFLRFVDMEDEYRVHIFNGKSIRMSRKSFAEDRSDYTTVKPGDGPRKHIRRAAKQAVKALGLDFGAVDLLANESEAYVLEVNAAPGLGGSMPRVWAQTFINHFEEDS